MRNIHSKQYLINSVLHQRHCNFTHESLCRSTFNSPKAEDTDPPLVPGGRVVRRVRYLSSTASCVRSAGTEDIFGLLPSVILSNIGVSFFFCESHLDCNQSLESQRNFGCAGKITCQRGHQPGRSNRSPTPLLLYQIYVLLRPHRGNSTVLTS
jgi:hypothetical protein